VTEGDPFEESGVLEALLASARTQQAVKVAD
jgi:hypothetical protein